MIGMGVICIPNFTIQQLHVRRRFCMMLGFYAGNILFPIQAKWWVLTAGAGSKVAS